jgi:hypothetical protein
MSLDSFQHPEVYSGSITDFGFQKVERQTKAVLKNILVKFFSSRSNLYKQTLPEIVTTQNSASGTRINIEREFPFYERKLPVIVITSKTKKEKKPFLGADDFLYQDYYISSTGAVSGRNMYANMYDVPIQLMIVANSPELRMQLAELVSMCFSHYYRWEYMYKGDDFSYFNIVPCQSKITITGETEIADKSQTSLIYVCSVSFDSYVEYIFPDVGDNFQEFIHEAQGFDTSSGYEDILVPIYVYSSTGMITSTGYYTSSGYLGTDFRWWLYEEEEEETSSGTPISFP